MSHTCHFLLGSISCVFHIRKGFWGFERRLISARLMIAEPKLVKAIGCGKPHLIISVTAIQCLLCCLLLLQKTKKQVEDTAGKKVLIRH